MTSKLLLVLLPVLFAACVSAQSPIYLLSGEATRKSTAKLPVTLHRFDQAGGLSETRVISASSVGSEFIHQSQEAGMIVVGAHSQDRLPALLMFVDFEHPERAFNYDMPETLRTKTRFASQFLDVPGIGWVYALSGLDKALIGVRLADVRAGFEYGVEPIPSSWFANLAMTGESGRPGTWNFDSDYVALDRSSGLLRLNQYGQELNLPPVPDAFRAAARPGSADLRAVNRHLVVLTVKGEAPLVYDRKSQLWRRLDLPGTSRAYCIKALGEFVSVIPWERVPEEELRATRARWIERNRAAAQGKTATGRPTAIAQDANDADDWSDARRTGGTYLYNVLTQKMFVLAKGKEDVELLLVRGGEVYYRQRDQLMRVRILGDGLGVPELLVKNEVMLGVHWAFMGGYQGTQGGPN